HRRRRSTRRSREQSAETRRLIQISHTPDLTIAHRSLHIPDRIDYSPQRMLARTSLLLQLRKKS
ncbi:MAG: hypothetical protein KDJ70_18410, partial [Candidatus Competibacteraceae bacterium]|nr:hypothetical protein [Candidatus Competibacteraceae bacterium]